MTEAGVPANGIYDFLFVIYNVPDSGSPGASALSSIPVDDLAVSNGLFTAQLGFEPWFLNDDQRWLEVQVRTNDSGSYTGLLPWTEITPTPYAVRALTVSSNALMNHGGAVSFSNPSNVFVGDGSGLTDVTLGGLSSSGFWQTGGNAGTTAGVNFLGTTDDQPLEFKVNGQRGLRIENNGDGSDAGSIPDGAPNVIGGSPVNFVAAGVVGATIAGGGATNYFGTASTNSVLADYGSVLGGIGNTASGEFSTAMGRRTIASGYSSTAMGAETTASGEFSTAMGAETTASGEFSTAMGYLTAGSGPYSTAMGIGNTASSYYSTAMGGFTVASGYSSTAMGAQTTASGEFSTAMGRRTIATHNGSFVWADSQEADFASSAADEFSVRAQNGLRIVNQGDGALLLHLATERSWGFRQLGTGSSTALELYNFSANKNFIINTTGNVGIGTTAPAFNLHVNGSAGKPGGGSWSTASDARLKDVGQPFTRGLEALKSIQPRHYHYTEDNALDLPSEPEYVGLIAQNVQTCIPEAIERNATGYLHVNNDPILWTMLNGIKELNAKIEIRSQRSEIRNRTLEEKLQQKETEMAKLVERLEKLERIIATQDSN